MAKAKNTEKGIAIIVQVISEIKLREDFKNTKLMKQDDIIYNGNDFLAWGYTTTFFSLAVYICLKLTDNSLCYLLYLGVPVMANIIVAVYNKNKPKTETERLINRIWGLFGMIGVLSCIGRYFYEFPLFALISLLMGLETVITGMIIKHRTVTALGFFGILGAVLLVVVSRHEQNLIILGIFIFIAITPGHILNRKSIN